MIFLYCEYMHIDQKLVESSKERLRRALQQPDKNCYADYPIKDGLLCYPRCKAGYSNYGQGPVCWAKCPSGTTNLGISCKKRTYSRGVGKLASKCRSNYEKIGILCFPKCKRGYNGLGPVCSESCRSGYADLILTCVRGPHVYFRDTS